MISALLSFLGGSAFRMLWGEISSWLNKRQDHAHEIERMRLQGDLDAAQHARNLDAIRLQADMGVRVIETQAAADVARIETQGWFEAVKGTTIITGVWLIDTWNGIIRPAVATWSVVMLTLNEFAVFTLSETTASVCYAALGIYLADRTLGKRGK